MRDEEKQASDALKDTQSALDLALIKYQIGQTDLSPVLQIEYMVMATQMASASVRYD